MSKWLVTGGAGYIGQNVLQLLQEGNKSFKSLDTKKFIDDSSTKFQDTHIIGNFGDVEILKRILDDIDGIIHLGAFKNSSESIQKEEIYRKNNLDNSITLFKMARKYGIKNFIFASSAAVYGPTKREPVDEFAQLLPNNPYGLQKKLFEEFLQLNSMKDTSFISLRIFNVIGIGFENKIGTSNGGLFSELVTKIQKDEPFPIYGNSFETSDGTAIRDFVNVVDVARAFLKAIDRIEEGEKLSQAINIATGKGLSIKTIINTFEQTLNKKIKYSFQQKRVGDTPVSIGVNKRASKELGWEASISVEETIQSICQKYLLY